MSSLNAITPPSEIRFVEYHVSHDNHAAKRTGHARKEEAKADDVAPSASAGRVLFACLHISRFVIKCE